MNYMSILNNNPVNVANVYDDETIINTTYHQRQSLFSNFSAILILVQKIFRQCYVDASSTLNFA